MPPNSSNAYRPEIDGLRAVAVLAVVLFHADIAGFPGGYVGVDVFFVISGYLITKIIAKGTDAGTFSFAAFYRRRIRRLFPAYIVLVVSVLLVGLTISMPKELVDLGQSLVASSVFATNVLFWLEAGYFAGASEIKPLLHTWSLSVEEQFYLFFPLMLVAAAKFAPNRRLTLVMVVLAGSLALSALTLSKFESATFYLLPTRAWELMLGSALALAPAGLHARFHQANWIAVAGLLAIAGSVFLMTPATPFPGLGALAPCLGAAAVIWAGNRPGIVNFLLTLPPMIFIGKISYSLYLWHWPIFAYYRYYNIHELTLPQSLIAIALSFLAAVLSWRFVEQPFRDSNLTPRFRPFLAVAGSSLLLLIVGFALIRAEGLPARLNEDVLAMLEQSAPVRDANCMAGPGRWIEADSACVYPAGTSQPSIAILGDSHAHALLPAINKAASIASERAVFYGYTACPPIPGVRRIGAGASSQCDTWNEVIFSRVLADESLDTVVIVARHAVYLFGFTGDFGPAEGKGGVEIELVSDQAVVAESALVEGYFSLLDAAVERYRSSGRKVVLVLPVPEVGYDVPTTLALMLRRGDSLYSFERPLSYYRERQSPIRRQLLAIAERHGAIVVDPKPVFCGANTCRVFSGGKPLYFDDDHLSVAGGDLLVPALLAAILPSEDAK